MVRAATIVLLLAAAALIATSVAWLVGTAPARPSDRDPSRVLADFERARPPTFRIPLASRYAGRTELLEPRSVLPSWHRYPRAEAAAVWTATRSCPPGALATPIADPALAKAYAWHARTCGGAPAPDDLVDSAPRIHPSGRSYAALAGREGASGRHVLELAGLQLDAETRALASLSASAWEGVLGGDAVVVETAWLVRAERASGSAPELAFYPRTDWDAAAARAGVALVPRAPADLCLRPATATLCWRETTTLERRRPTLLGATLGSAAVAVGAGFALSLGLVRERRRAHADRIHVLRTLTHELRTPATSLALELEPLRDAYDQLPEVCQDSVLRLADGVARLNRVIHRSARYLALFETTGRRGASDLAAPRAIESARALFEEMRDEWPPDVDLEGPEDDAAIETDPEWLSVALRNLVENATRHGAPPVRVAWGLEGDWLAVRVRDAGATPELSLAHALEPYHRDPSSPGLGLGLAIVARVAKLLGGTLVHEPSPTTFELRVRARAGTR